MNYQLKKGYKLTEVGVIPEDWDVKQLGNLARIQRGASPRPIDSPIWFDNNSTVGWVRISDVTRSGMYLRETVQKLSPLGIQHSRPVEKNTLIMSICATVGRPIITEINICIHDGFVVFDALQTEQLFMYYVLKWIEPDWSKHGQTGSQMNLNTELINGKTIRVPPLPEQRSLATALSDMDALLVGIDRLIAKKRDLKQAAMQQLLTGKKRLPGFGEGKAYKETEIGEIPEDWEVQPLRTALSISPKYGINAAAVPYQGKLPAYIRITDISEDGRFQPDKLVAVEHPDSSQYFLEEGDLVFARTGASVGKSYLYDPNDGKLVYAGFLIKIKPDKNILLSEFLSHYVKTKPYWNWVQVMSMRSGQPGINGNEYGQLLLSLPHVNEQTAIATILSDMDAEIAALEQRRDKTRALKQGMMQELLTGRIRLIDNREKKQQDIHHANHP